MKEITPGAWLLILSAIGFAIYFSGLTISYYGDDFGYVFAAPSTKILYYFSHRNPNHQFYRPINSSILAIIQHFCGLKTWPMHLINILFHVLLSWLVYLFMIKQRFSKSSTVAGSVFMVVSQANAMAVLSNDTFSQICGTFFGCATLWLLDRSLATSEGHRDGPSPGVSYSFYLLSLCAFSISLLSKETSVSFLPLSFGVLLIRNWDRKNRRFILRRSTIEMVPFIALTILYALVRWPLGLGQPAAGQEGYNFHVGFNVVRNFTLFLMSAAVPISSARAFSLVYNRHFTAALSVAILSFAVILVVLYGVWRSGRHRFFLLVGGFALVALFPAILLGHISELYLYNAMPFLAVLVGAGLGRLLDLNRARSLRFAASTAIFTLLFASHVIAIQSKASLMEENGERATELLQQIQPYLARVPKNGKLFLVNPASSQVEYSVFLLNGFNVLRYGENIINQIANRHDFRVEVVEHSELDRVGSEKDGVVLTLRDGIVRAHDSAAKLEHPDLVTR